MDQSGTGVRKRWQRRLVEETCGLNDLTQDEAAFRFQLAYMAEQCEDILDHLPKLIQHTEAASPLRSDDFCLERQDNRGAHSEEARWEEAMWRKWGPLGSGEIYLAPCPRLQTYQFPLRKRASDSRSRWGKVDLLGVSPRRLPVINELKKAGSMESPLRMIIEMAAYGIAVQRGWGKLRPGWEGVMYDRFEHDFTMPDGLERPLLIGVAPQAYWNRVLGLNAHAPAGRVPEKAWPPFWRLVDALELRFDIAFAIVEGINGDPVPAISAAQLLDLRAATAALASPGRTQ